MSSQLPDFDAVYRGQDVAPGADGQVPWNIGVPQPAIASVIDAGVQGPVLDAGCGVGVTTLELAARGYEVLGVDASETAIAQAESARDDRHATARFQVGDITTFSGYDGHFATVIDSTLFHSLPIEGRDPYLAAIARATRPGGRLYMLVFEAGSFPVDDGPNAVTTEELRDAVQRHWTIDSIEASSIAAFLPAQYSQEYPIDEQGRTRIPAHFLTAHR